LGNPLSWRMADRCLAIAILMVFATAVVTIATFAGGWPFLPFPASEGPAIPYANGSAMVLWAGLAVVSRRLRGDDSAQLLVIATVVMYAVTLAAFTLIDGPFAAPGWIAYLGGAVVGYVLFPRWISLTGIVLYAVLVIGLAAVLGSGRVPTMFAPVSAYTDLDVATVVRRAAASLALFGRTFSVIAFVVDRWRAREAGYLVLASTDALTGLTNRHRFMEVATAELARSRRYASPLSLIVIDLDHFKRINDEHGHLIGDRALVHAAQVLASSVRDVDVIARHGGEEFAVMLPMTDVAGAVEVAERCTRRLSETPLMVDGVGAIRITASMGVTSCTGSACGDLDDLLRVADAALYRAKQAGRDRVEVAGSAPCVSSTP
jgi:diguanylate cyclase (GGDEF)-like protein